MCLQTRWLCVHRVQAPSARRDSALANVSYSVGRIISPAGSSPWLVHSASQLRRRPIPSGLVSRGCGSKPPETAEVSPVAALEAAGPKSASRRQRQGSGRAVPPPEARGRPSLPPPAPGGFGGSRALRGWRPHHPVCLRAHDTLSSVLVKPPPSRTLVIARGPPAQPRTASPPPDPDRTAVPLAVESNIVRGSRRKDLVSRGLSPVSCTTWASPSGALAGTNPPPRGWVGETRSRE